MSSADQNGRPPQPDQQGPPTDPRTRSGSDSQGICRDYVWGICLMNTQCKYKHELEFESMKSILRFCHDFQNRTGCTRPDCTYLHTSREEQTLFLTTGQIPRVLAERYAAMALPSGNNSAQEYVFTNEYLSQPPPPPPPPTTTTTAPPPPAPVLAMGTQLPTQGMQVAPQVNMPMPPIMAPPPPPPPPPPAANQTPRISSSYTTPPPSAQIPVAFPISQPPPHLNPLMMFDPSRPPPPLPLVAQNRAEKRISMDSTEAGPSKSRKTDVTNDGSCDSCFERDFRLSLIKQKTDLAVRDEECFRNDYEKRHEDFEQGRLLLKSVFAEVYNMFEEYITSDDSPLMSHALCESLVTSIFQATRGATSSTRNMRPSQNNYPNISINQQQVPQASTSGRNSSQSLSILYSQLYEMMQNAGIIVPNNRVESFASGPSPQFSNGLPETVTYATNPGSSSSLSPNYSSIATSSAARYPLPTRPYATETPAITANALPLPNASPMPFYSPAVLPPPSTPYYAQPYPPTPINGVYANSSNVGMVSSPRASTSTTQTPLVVGVPVGGSVSTTPQAPAPPPLVSAPPPPAPHPSQHLAQPPQVPQGLQAPHVVNGQTYPPYVGYPHPHYFPPYQ